MCCSRPDCNEGGKTQTEACVCEIHVNQHTVGADKKYQLLQMYLVGGK